jgi:hypothetical protein
MQTNKGQDKVKKSAKKVLSAKECHCPKHRACLQA